MCTVREFLAAIGDGGKIQNTVIYRTVIWRRLALNTGNQGKYYGEP